MAQASYSNLNRRDGKYELGAAELFLSHCVWFRCFLGVAPLPFERASLAALTVDAGNSDLPSINEREGISSNRNPPAFSTRSLTADVMSFQFWNLVCSRTHMVCAAPALPSTIEMCSSLRKLFRRLVMADIERISVQQAQAKTKANQALLVCAYEDEAKCRMLNLEGSISFASLQSRAASLPKTQVIIFY